MRLGSSLLPAVVAGALLLIAAEAEAQTSHVQSTSWRQNERGDKVTQKGSSQNFAFELRFGAYYPQIDQETYIPAGATPYETVFNDNPQFYIGLEFDYLPQWLRIPWVGVIGPGFGWGRTRTSTPAKFSTGPDKGQLSGETTGLTIMPMHFSAVLRADEIMRRTGVPLVPYGKIGFGFGTWSVDTDAGTETFVRGKDTIKGSGLSYGLVYAIGGMLSLNFLDPSSAARLDETTSINHAYLFGEWMNNSGLGRGSKGMYIGTSTWVAGLAIDL